MSDDLIKELDRLVKLRDDDHWSSTRDVKNFSRVLVNTPMGERVTWVPKSDSHNKDLQSSRSVGLGEVNSDVDLERSYEDGMSMTDTDLLRANEIEECVDTWNKFGDQTGLGTFEITGMCEIGFRYPRLMNFYSEKYNIKSFGYDISTLAVEFGKKKGFDVRECDLNNMSDYPIDLNGANVFCMYHVLEHVKNPIETLSFLHKFMPNRSFLHVEVPIEMNNPQFDYGHLFGMHHGDLASMCSIAGFKVFSLVNKNVAGAIQIERVGCIKYEQ